MAKERTITLPDGEVTGRDLLTITNAINKQADLKAINWCRRFTGGKQERLKAMTYHRKGIAANRSKLEAWAGRVGPKGPYLVVARSMYRQLVRELERIDTLIAAQGGQIEE